MPFKGLKNKANKMNTRKSLGVPTETYTEITRIAVEITAKTGKDLKWTDVANFMLEHYLDDVKLDMVAKLNPKSLEAFIRSADYQ